MRKITYQTPSAEVVYVETAALFCAGSSVNDSASIGTPGGGNEQEQPIIDTGGPGVSGAKKHQMWYEYEEED